MTDAASGAQTPTGDEQPSGEQQPVTAEQLTEFRREMSQELSGALSAWTKRLDVAGQIKTALESINPPAEEKKPPRADGKGSDEVATLRKQLQAQDQELSRERKSTAIRAALSKRGLSGTALEDATEALLRREDIGSEVDETGRRNWSGSVATQHGPLTKPLDDVVGSWLQDRTHLLPPQHRGGSGATGGGSSSGPGGAAPKSLLDPDMSPEEVAAMSDEDLDKLWVGAGGRPEGTQRGLYADVKVPKLGQ